MSTINHMILPCHHCHLCIHCILFCLLAHIITLFPVLGDTVQHLHDLLAPYPWSPKSTNVLNYSFVCWHLAQHMLTRNSSHVSELLFQTLHIYSYHQLLTTGFENFHHNNWKFFKSFKLKLTTQNFLHAYGLLFLVAQYISKQWYHLSKHSG